MQRVSGRIVSLVLVAMGSLGGFLPAQHSSVRPYGKQTGADPVQPDKACSAAAISADGRVVALRSKATNLSETPNSNGTADVYVFTTQAPGATRVSISSSGVLANGDCFDPALSEDGSVVTFMSFATNLVAGDSNLAADIFVHDRGTGQTTRVSVDSNAGQADASSFTPSISADGTVVAFYSEATNLVTGDTNGSGDVFVHDRMTGQTTRVSVDSVGNQGNLLSSAPRISGDGNLVVFESLASNLVANDSNGVRDIFVHRRTTGVTQRVSVASDGSQANGFSLDTGISQNGRYVTFSSGASNLVAQDNNGTCDAFRHDLNTVQTVRVSLADGGGEVIATQRTSRVADDGTVLFHSPFPLVAGDTNLTDDLFLHEHGTLRTVRVSVSSTGVEATDSIVTGDLSADGLDAVFDSKSSSLAPDDTNGKRDVFVHRSASRGITLDAQPVLADLNATAELAMGGGQPGQRALVFLLAVDSLPLPIKVALASFDGQGRWTLSGTIPSQPSISQHWYTFQSYGLTTAGVQASNQRFLYIR